MAFRKCDSIILNVIPAAAQNLRDLEGGTGKIRHHGTPDKIAVADSRQRAVALLCQLIQLMCKRRRRIPRVQRLLAGRDRIDPMLRTDCKNILQLRNGTSCCNDAYVRLPPSEKLIRLACRRNRDSRCWIAISNNFCGILSENGRVPIKRRNKLCPFFNGVADQILSHFAAAILCKCDFSFHRIPPLQFFAF